MKSSVLKLLVATLTLMALHPCSLLHGAENRPSGVVVFTEKGNGYPESRDYLSLKRASNTFSVIVRTNGEPEEIANSGIVANFAYPAGPVDPSTTRTTLDQIGQVLAKYPRSQFPELHSKLNSLAAVWRTAQQMASIAPKPAPAASTSTVTAKMTITTVDGRRYEEVVITKVGDEAVSFEHSAGVSTVPLSALPPDLQRKFNYDPQRVAQEAARRQEIARARQQAEASATQVAAPPIAKSDSLVPSAQEKPEQLDPPDDVIVKGMRRLTPAFADKPFRRGKPLVSRGVAGVPVGTEIYPVKFDGYPVVVYYVRDEFDDWKVFIEQMRTAVPIK